MNIAIFPPAEHFESPGSSVTVDVPIDELIIGRAIQFPVYANDGTLLLAAGCTITSEMKKSLKARNIMQIAVNSADANIVTMGGIVVNDTASAVQLGTELTSKLDEIIDAGILTVKNNGPAVKDRVVFVGCKAYDQKQRERLVESQKQRGQLLGDMIRQTLHGQRVDGQGLKEMASAFLHELTSDADCVLTSAMDRPPGNDFIWQSLETAVLSMAIGVEMGYDADNVQNLGVYGLVNNWGMMRVPDRILNSPNVLTPVEMLEIKKHPIHSLEMLQRVPSLPKEVSLVAYQVHEQPNGGGYPRGRNGNSIHPFARIIQVSDAFVGLSQRRPYRPPYMKYAAMECLLKKARDRSVDPDVVRALLRIQSLFPIGSYVTLSDGSVACVMRRNGDNYTQPFVQRVQDTMGRRISPSEDDLFLDLAEQGLTVEQALPTPGTDEIALDTEIGSRGGSNAVRSRNRV